MIYVYFDYKAQHEQTGPYVARTLLKQLLYLSEGIPLALEHLYDEYIKSNTQPTVFALSEIIAWYSRTSPVFAVFDALDECADHLQKEILSLLEVLQKSRCQIMVSARPHLEGIEGQLCVEKLRIAANPSDLKNYILSRLESERNINRSLEMGCLKLIEGASEMYKPSHNANNANKRFLLLKFQLDHVLSLREPRNRIKALDSVPRDMSSAYNDIMQRIENSKNGDKELAIKVLTWLFHALAPLHMQELLEALVIEEGDDYLHREDMLQPIDVIDCCKSLVIQDTSSGLVRFTHYTVQEYIGTLRAVLLSQQYLSMVCLTSIACRDVPGRDMITPTFQDYAFRFWAEHVRGEPEQCRNIQFALNRVLLTRELLHHSTEPILHFMARHRLPTTIRVMLSACGLHNPKYVLTSEPSELIN